MVNEPKKVIAVPSTPESMRRLKEALEELVEIGRIEDFAEVNPADHFGAEPADFNGYYIEWGDGWTTDILVK